MALSSADHLHLLVTLNEVRLALSHNRENLERGAKTYGYLSRQENFPCAEDYRLLDESYGFMLEQNCHQQNKLVSQLRRHARNTPFSELKDDQQEMVRALDRRIIAKATQIIPWLSKLLPIQNQGSGNNFHSENPIKVQVWFDIMQSVYQKLVLRPLELGISDVRLEFKDSGVPEYKFAVSSYCPPLRKMEDLAHAGFEPSNLMRLLWEHSGLDWSDMLEIQSITIKDIRTGTWLDLAELN